MTEFELGWVVGLIEGEGSFGLKYGRYPTISVQMTDLDVLEKLLSIVKVGYINFRGKQKDHHKDSWKWELQHSEKAADFLRQIIPYLGKRRKERAQEVLAGYVAYQLSLPEHQFTMECLVEGCKKQRKARGVCKSHHEFYRRRNWEGIPGGEHWPMPTWARPEDR